jgi:O-antigen/teichoic acid export membrane protein
MLLRGGGFLVWIVIAAVLFLKASANDLSVGVAVVLMIAAAVAISVCLSVYERWKPMQAHAPTSVAPSQSSISDELEKLASLRGSRVISDDDYEQAKRKLLS